MTPETYRGLRGIVLHVVPYMRDRYPDWRDQYPDSSIRRIIPALDSRKWRTTCKWCELPTPARPTGRHWWWHESCIHWYLAARGAGDQITWQDQTVVVPRVEHCPSWNGPKELDHQLALGRPRVHSGLLSPESGVAVSCLPR